MVKKFYITTTIPYANAPPHMGHALEFVQADVLARWKKQKGYSVFFLTGTDEHGTKNYQTAKKQGLNPQEFVDKNANFFKKLIKLLNISNTNFIRTTDKKNHWPGVIDIWKKLKAKGDIYKKKYSGFYCTGCERFVTEKDLINGKCPNHPTKEIEVISEENYFFKLSKYSEEIKEKIKSGELRIYPNKWKNDFLSLIKEGLIDVSFSRSKNKLPWGVPVPGDKNQVMYVWCDALTNYLTGIGYPNEKYKKYWPADIHVVGKDMLRFHTGIWPGMLLSAGLPLPKKVIVHGFLTIDGKKMSKSTGNVIDPIEISEKYGADSIRYFFCRNFVFGEDGDISEKGIVTRHNDELANKLGNLISRVSSLIEKYGIEKTENKIKLELRLKKAIKTGKAELGVNEKGSLHIFRKYPGSKKGKVSEVNWSTFLGENPTSWLEAIELFAENYMENFELDKSLNEIFKFIDHCNWYIQIEKPWSNECENPKKVLYELKEAILKIAELLWPFIPESSEKITKQFNAKDIKKEEILFKKIELVDDLKKGTISSGLKKGLKNGL